MKSCAAASDARHNVHMCKPRYPSARGFTLVELMIVVGVIGILASIAIPGYQKLTARSHRSEMVTAMGKFKFFFKNAHDNNGTFETSDVASEAAAK